MGEIASECGFATSNCTVLVDALENQGYATRKRDEDDRRTIHVHITKLGEAALAKVESAVSKLSVN